MRNRIAQLQQQKVLPHLKEILFYGIGFFLPQNDLPFFSIVFLWRFRVHVKRKETLNFNKNPLFHFNKAILTLKAFLS